MNSAGDLGSQGAVSEPGDVRKRRREVNLALWGIIVGVVSIIAGGVFWLWPRSPRPPAPEHTGWVLDKPALYVRQTPSSSGPIVGSLQYGTKVYLVCTRKGTPVYGPGLDGKELATSYWDYVRTDPSAGPVGFVPDAWIDTGTTTPLAPPC